jgi:urease accessory protein
MRSLSVLGGVIGTAVTLHAMLHGQEASGTAGWWLGALLASALTIAISYAAGNQLNQRQNQIAAAALSLLGGALAIAPL